MVLYGEDDEETYRRILESEADMVNRNHPDVFIRVRRQLAERP